MPVSENGLLELGLYGHRAKLLGSHLISSVRDTIAEGDLSPRHARALVVRAINDIGALPDCGLGDSEPYEAIAHVLSKAFQKAGLSKYEADEIRGDYDAYKKHNPGDAEVYFADTSWYDPRELAFWDAFDAFDGIQGKINNLVYYHREGLGRKDTPPLQIVQGNGLPDDKAGLVIQNIDGRIIPVVDGRGGASIDVSGRPQRIQICITEIVQAISLANEAALAALPDYDFSISMKMRDFDEGRPHPIVQIECNGIGIDLSFPKRPDPNAVTFRI